MVILANLDIENWAAKPKHDNKNYNDAKNGWHSDILRFWLAVMFDGGFVNSITGKRN